jgi:hypothetical protein
MRFNSLPFCFGGLSHTEPHSLDGGPGAAALGEKLSRLAAAATAVLFKKFLREAWRFFILPSRNQS